MCLYLTLTSRARSLPTLIALFVNKEMVVNMVKLKVAMTAVQEQRSVRRCSVTTEM